MRHERQTLLSEIKELDEILLSIPDENVIERLGFEVRLKRAQTELESKQFSVEPEKTRLTFRGAPVFGSDGIAADFGSKAAGHFAEAYSAIVAGMRDRLRYMGPIPHKSRNQLAITGVATGSFGFEFELPDLHSTLFSESGGAEEALQTLLALLEKAANGSDDDVTEVVHAVHPRAVKKVVEFLEFMEKKGAWCGVEFKHHVFRYSDIEQLKHAKSRLSDGNIKHAIETFRGSFEGSLPKPRTFQFQPAGDDNPIMGRFDPSIDAQAINRDWLNKPVSVKFDVMQVGQGRPRYTLLEIGHISRL
jgi:hypothetical protein